MALYDITQKDTLDSANAGQGGNDQAIAIIDDTHAVVVQTDSSGHGHIKILTWGSNLLFTGTPVVDDYELTDEVILYPELVILQPGVIVLVRKGEDGDGFMNIFTYDESYQLTNEKTGESGAEIEFNTSTSSNHSMVKLDDTHVAVGSQQYISGTQRIGAQIFEINASTYVITEKDLLSVTLASGGNSSTAIDKIQDGKFVMVWSDSSLDGRSGTFSYDQSTYVITKINEYEYNTSAGTNGSMLRYKSNRIAVSHAGHGGIGTIKTISYDSNFDNLTNIDEDRFEVTDSRFNTIGIINDDIAITAFDAMGPDDGVITIFSIDEDDLVVEQDTKRVTFDTNSPEYCRLEVFDTNKIFLCTNRPSTDIPRYYLFEVDSGEAPPETGGNNPIFFGMNF